jgi:quinate dehydrogenase (quinone)
MSGKTPTLLTRSWFVLLGIVILAARLIVVLGGAKLALLGGSLYFVIAGVALVAAGVQIVRGRPNGALIFGVTFALTSLWALWEVGLSFWPLVSRLLAMGAGATVVAVSYLLLRAARGRTPAWRPALVTAAVIGLASAGGLAAMFVPHAPVAFAGTESPLLPVDAAQAQKNWEAFGNTAGGSRFVALDQIARVSAGLAPDGYASLPAGETALELSYGLQLRRWLSLRADVQYILDPGAFGFRDTRNALALGSQIKAAF